MDKRIMEAFGALRMEEDCVSRIEQAMQTAPEKRAPARPIVRTVAAVLLLAVLIIALNPTAAQAVEKLAEKAWNCFTRSPGTVVLEEDYVYYNDGNIELESKAGDMAMVSGQTGANPDWLKIMDGRVYYTGNAESTDLNYFLENKEQFDITGQFSEEEPFVSTFEKDGITHYIAIGGNFDPEIGYDSIGYLERLRRTDKIDEGLFAGWIGGSGRMQYRDAEGNLFPIWYAKAVVELEIPWDNAEAKKQLEDWEASQ